MNVDYQAMDFGTVMKRRETSKPPAQGGWNLYCIGIPGLVGLTPATHLALLGDGSGRPNDPKMQELREGWFNAADLTAQKAIGEEMQLQAFENVPYYPLGLAQIPAAVRPDIAGIPDGFPLFWSVEPERRSEHGRLAAAKHTSSPSRSRPGGRIAPPGAQQRISGNGRAQCGNELDSIPSSHPSAKPAYCNPPC